MTIPSTLPDLTSRQREINIQIGLDMHAFSQRLLALEACCRTHATPAPGMHQPVLGDDVISILNQIVTVSTTAPAARMKRDIKLIPVTELGVMDMALTADGDLLHDSGLQTAVLMSLFSDKRHENQRGFWADEFIGRQTGSHLWLLKREKTLTNEHKEGSVLRRAEDYCKQALKWLVDSGDATGFTISARWGSDQITERMLLKINIQLPDGSRFAGY